MRKNPFRALTEQEKEEKEKEKKSAALRIEAVSKLASECLDDPKFKKYRKEYEAMRDKAFHELADPHCMDPIEDAFHLRSCINTILVLGLLLKSPERDAKKP